MADVLPQIISLCEERWQLKVTEPFELSYNDVARTDSDQTVIKICLPGPEYNGELNTLKHYEGQGFCKVIDSIEEKSVLLLESLNPGGTTSRV